MSDVMERTLASIPRLLSSALLGGGRGGQTPRKSQPTQSFQNFLRSIDTARGHSEQAALVQRELSRIKQLFQLPDASVNRWCESFPEIIFCSILGHDVSFFHIYALKLAGQGKGWQKRVGYLAATLLLDHTCDLTIMITGTLFRDLSSSNMVDNLMALNAAAELVSTEHIPQMLPPVVKLLRHRQSIVRARVVHCMHTFFQRAPGLMHSHLVEVTSMLGDKDPGVLMAVVTTVEALVRQSREEFVALGPALVSILQQIRAYKFPIHLCYHSIPLPWLQVKLLKTLSHLAALDDNITSSLLPLLTQILRETVGKEMMSLAVLEESLLTVAALAKAGNRHAGREASESAEAQPRLGLAGWSGEEARCGETDRSSGGNFVQGRVMNEGRKPVDDDQMSRWKPLLEEASRCVASFLGADLPNLRYIGVKVLTQLVSVNAELAVLHKDRVVTCLSDPDLIIRRQTLTLLHHMAVRDNFKAVCTTMLKHVQQGDSGSTADIVDMVVDISHRMNSDPEWYLHTIFPLLSLRLDQTRLSAIMDSMLVFFTKASQDSQWPQFPDLLFTTMVDHVVSCQGKGDPSVQFSLRVLRFVSLPAHTTFRGETLLAACMKLLGSDTCTGELREQVVLCVQALLLRGLLVKTAVVGWARTLLDESDHVTPYQYRLRLSELLRLASLDASLSSLAGCKSPEQMDFSLSFLEPSFKTLQRKSQPFLRQLRRDERLETDSGGLLQGATWLVSARSEEASSSVSSQDSSPLDAGTSPCSESGKDDNSPLANVLKTLPGVRQRWTKHGFNNNNADETKSSAVSTVSDTTVHRQVPVQAAKQGDREEDLAQALFQGLSPLSSAVPSSPPTMLFTASASHKSSTSSGFDSSSSQNSTGTGGQDSPMCGHPEHHSSLHPTPASTCQYDVLHSRAGLGSDTVDEEADVLFSPSAPNSWKVLHAAYADSQTKSTPVTKEQESSGVQGESLSSYMESTSNLSISDDSLENTDSCSIPNSPTKQAPQSLPGSGKDKRPEDGDTPEIVLSLFLEAEMTEKESLGGEELRADSEADSLYSGFEILAHSTRSQDSRDEVTET